MLEPGWYAYLSENSGSIWYFDVYLSTATALHPSGSLLDGEFIAIFLNCRKNLALILDTTGPYAQRLGVMNFEHISSAYSDKMFLGTGLQPGNTTSVRLSVWDQQASDIRTWNITMYRKTFLLR